MAFNSNKYMFCGILLIFHDAHAQSNARASTGTV